MSQTTVIVSNLDKSQFVASKQSNVSLAGHIKSALSDPQLYGPKSQAPHKIIAHWSELPFLNRIIAIFETEPDALCAYEFLRKTRTESSSKLPFVLPETARISLQENLLQKSKSSDSLTEDHALRREKSPESHGSKSSHSTNAPVSGDLAGYHEPEPKPLDIYGDLLKSGIDISKFNSSEQVEELRYASGRQGRPGLDRSKSLTKTLFKPSLSIDTNVSHNGEAPPLSPTITLDQS
ncbi:hypothetical protein JCM33374_g2687 [Metschnikowia sp. JCM 33374]|nr:hypothetical protein JCM33374_g2687 [Metschnikowia sp. JCM 33374]